MSVTIACMKWGDWPHPADYVNRLYHGVTRHLSTPHRFVCLSDEWQGFDSGIEVIEFQPFQTWNLNKMKLFDPDLFEGRVISFDLDVEIVGSLDDMASYSGEFCTIRDWFDHEAGGCINAWEGGEHAHLWEIVNTCDVTPFRGSERMFFRYFFNEPDYWQDVCPGQFVSWKATKDHSTARVICFHGRPRPHEVIWSPAADQPVSA